MSALAFPLDGHPINPTAQDLAKWAHLAHIAACRSCRNELCPTGAHLEAAARTATDLPNYPSI